MSDPEFGKHFESRPQERVGKVYRKMFSFQPQSLPNQRGALAEGIPPAFRSPFIKDVSESYFDGIDLRGQKEIRLPGRFRQPELGACRLEPDKARAGCVRSCRKGLRLYGHVL